VAARPLGRPAPVGAEDHTTVLPAVADNRTTTGLRRPANGFQLDDDVANAHRTTAGLRRPDPITSSGSHPAVADDQPGTRSGNYPAVADEPPGMRSSNYPAVAGDRPVAEGRGTAAGAYPVVREDRATSSGGFAAFSDDEPAPLPGGSGIIGAGRATSTGTFRPVGDDPAGTGGPRPAVESRATGSGGFPAVESRATGSGGFPAVESRATSTGTHAPVGERRATSTGGFRIKDGRAAATGSHAPVGKSTSTGGFRISESRGTSTGSHRPVGNSTTEGRSSTTGGHRTVAEEGRSTSTGGHRTAAEEGHSTSTGGHRTATDGRSTVTGTHRAMGKVAGRRRIAMWPIFAGAFVVLLVVGLLGWGWANNVLNSRAEAQANACTDGNSTITVVVTPTVQKPVSAAAARWNQANTVVHAHCVHVDVRAIPSQQVLDALTGKADLRTIGGLPAAWLPENSFWVDQLQTTKPGMVGSPAESIASARSADYPFLGLAGNTVDEVQARAAQVFRDYLREPAQQADFTAAGFTG
jgi:hypothetical protein